MRYRETYRAEISREKRHPMYRYRLLKSASYTPFGNEQKPTADLACKVLITGRESREGNDTTGTATALLLHPNLSAATAPSNYSKQNPIFSGLPEGDRADHAHGHWPDSSPARPPLPLHTKPCSSLQSLGLRVHLQARFPELPSVSNKYRHKDASFGNPGCRI